MRILVKGPSLKSLTTLSLRDAEMKPESIRLLVKSALFTKLESFDLSKNGFRDDHMAMLILAPESPRLTALSLRENELTEPMTKAA